MKQIYILIGLPGAGKSTWARRFIEKNQNSIIICHDDFRKSFKGKYTFEDGLEQFIFLVGEEIIKLALNENFDNIIIDECLISNTIEKRRELISFLRLHNVYINAIVFKTDVETCVNRRMIDNKGVSTAESWRNTILIHANSLQEINENEDFDKIVYL
jgi:predicted kinase